MWAGRGLREDEGAQGALQPAAFCDVREREREREGEGGTKERGELDSTEEPWMRERERAYDLKMWLQHYRCMRETPQHFGPLGPKFGILHLTNNHAKGRPSHTQEKRGSRNNQLESLP